MPSKPPQDIVAIFHTSFHPTRGNVLDWYFSVDNDLDLDNLGLEFSALPSGLHQLDEDVVYFTTTGKSKSSAKPQTYHAIALFRRRRTTHPLYRGFLLGSLGVLVAGPGEYGPRARSWRHLPALREVAERCYSRPGSEPSLTEGKLVDLGAPEGGDWFEPAREYFESRKARALGTQESWTNWKDEIYDEVRSWMCSGDRGTSCAVHSTPATLTDISPTLALPSLLTLLGPASLTLYRHLLTRKRILIYTKPPVEYACVLCYAAVDMVRSIQEGEQLIQQGYKDDADEEAKITLIPPKHVPGEATRVLGMVTLHDLLGSKFTDENDTDADDEEGSGGRGWIACTTDALFLEKPAYYDLLIDLTSVGVSSSSTVAFTTSKRKKKKGPKENKKPVHYKRVPSRWAWSDARLWGELDKVLRAPPNSSSTYTAFGEKPGPAASGAGAWLADAWQLYEDVCLVCAGAWMGTLRTRNLGLGVAADGEGYGDVSASAAGEARKREKYAALLEEGVEQAGDFGHSHTHGETSHIDAAAAAVGVSNETEPQPNQDAGDHYHDHDFTLVAPPTPDTREGLDILLHTAALHAVFPSNLNLADAVTKTEGILAKVKAMTMTVTPRDLLSLDLNPLSAVDVKYLESVQREYASRVHLVHVGLVVKRGWRDLVGVVFGL
ncbi:hypothetical protein DFP72DRAFT_1016174 [Ephemerocybe angulata]|uniref:DUF4484 domain-containing protein n=1 Tax=Ephemerocybe angulata TaxID=980116 RepID=A0A8H6HJK2_9AGAR|nr:hypothetical protein DFP72DRAFT_1016174 [Tulosesus angulatus]